MGNKEIIVTRGRIPKTVYLTPKATLRALIERLGWPKPTTAYIYYHNRTQSELKLTDNLYDICENNDIIMYVERDYIDSVAMGDLL
jgi:hypothetical protein